MANKGRLVVGALTLVLTLAMAQAAIGATSQDIAADLADGQLDGQYTQAELAEFRQNAMVQTYGEPETRAAGQVAPAQSQAAEVAQVETLPFTGVDLAVMVAGAGFLIGLGLVVRRAGRGKA